MRKSVKADGVAVERTATGVEGKGLAVGFWGVWWGGRGKGKGLGKREKDVQVTSVIVRMLPETTVRKNLVRTAELSIAANQVLPRACFGIHLARR